MNEYTMLHRRAAQSCILLVLKLACFPLPASVCYSVYVISVDFAFYAILCMPTRPDIEGSSTPLTGNLPW